MKPNDLELKLSGLPTPDGEIALADLVAITSPLQELALRVGRLAADEERPGRSHAAVENVARLRLTGVVEGSTRLLIAYGQPDVLPIDDGLEQRTADLFWDVVYALGSDRKPDWTTPLIDESAVRLLDGLSRADEVALARGAEQPMTFRPASVDRAPWTRSRRVADEEATMVGLLEAVDLASGRFRLRDDVGNRVPLQRVVDPHGAAKLVDQKVSATGHPIRSAMGEFRGLDSAALEPFVLPQEWTADARTDWHAILSRPGPDPDGGDLTDDEFAAFMAALEG
ncbi:hypothetical protein [Blastococcus capsensis]|uniref:hypothetical protein n=1 Tax=Blastococcus capsensis TaxID=1564163 RepID=UPI002540E94E|nr:hypothetical protein [Blastococcus capsensis]MDK3255195.1 hypothetical protein [Blastococcus capsensis]